MWKLKILEEEKERLIREHAPHLGGFLHPDLVQKAKKMAAYEAEPTPTDYLSKYKIN